MINFISRIGIPDFEREQIDIAVLFGDGRWPGLDAHLLHGEEMVPICSPRLIENLDYSPTSNNLRDYSLLHIATRPRGWTDWLSASGLTGIDGENGPKFEHFTMAMQAAIAGLGVALLPTFAIEDELANGRIVAPFGPPRASPFDYYATCPTVIVVVVFGGRPQRVVTGNPPLIDSRCSRQTNAERIDNR